MKLKRLSVITLSMLFLFSFPSLSLATDGNEERSSGGNDQLSTSVEFICEHQTRDLSWGVDGGRENNAAKTYQRVWGWSTCKNSNGTDIEHYTRARYENRITSAVYNDSGRKWGTGTVPAKCPWEKKANADAMAAKVYYGT